MRSSLLKKHYQAQDENLGTYFEHLNGFLQKEAYTNEIYMREELQIETQFEDSLNSLRTTKNKKDKTIDGVPNYQILANRQY